MISSLQSLGSLDSSWVVAKDSDQGGKGDGNANQKPLDDRDKRPDRPGRGRDSRDGTNHRPD